MHLTQNFINKSADQLISKLRQQHAADEAYIQELEEGMSPKYEKEISDLKEKLSNYDELKKQYSALNRVYQQLLNSPELGIDRYRNKISELEKEIEDLKSTRDNLIFRLNQK